MKWIQQDIEMYQQAKEYVDTAIIPLLPVAFGDDMKNSASMAEFLSLLTGQLERQFTGRLLLLPTFTYLKDHDLIKMSETLTKWEEKLLENGINHIFYITSDQDWRSIEENHQGTLLWLPVLPLSSMPEAQKVLLIEDQVKQLMGLFTQKWRKDEK